MNTPQKPKDVPDPVPIPDDDFDEFLQWTDADEAAFWERFEEQGKKLAEE